jgi:hypothetical protein
MARSTNAPCKGRIQMRKTNPLHLLKFGLQRTAGPYKWVKTGNARREQMFSALLSILLQKSCWGVERKFLEPLMRFTRGDVRDRIASSKIDHGPSWRL